MKDLFKLLSGLLDFGLKNNLIWSLKFCERSFNNVASIENHLKEVSLTERIKWRRMIALCYYRSRKYRSCLKYIT